MNKTAYEQGVEAALTRFKVAFIGMESFKDLYSKPDTSWSGRVYDWAGSPSGQLAGATAGASAIPVMAATRAAHTAPEGQKGTDALATGAGSVIGGIGGTVSGAGLGAALGMLGPRSLRHHAPAWAVLGGIGGLGLGQLLGAVAGHEAHKSWRGKDKPGPASPGEKTEQE